MSNGLMSKSSIISAKFAIKMVIIFTFTQMLNEKAIIYFLFWVHEKSGYKLIYNSEKLSGRGKRYYEEKNTPNLICPKRP